ncbi:hypothetical protein PQR70_22980 [Paraburkholderia madseniana]|nr:hypothetical protein [Paraburkholderia sp. SECH4]MCX4170829.1 hypothetical protein [Paraburkholderia madseniana]MDQ6458841.1 hypothetical protein [Paraburkholderia madseniana]
MTNAGETLRSMVDKWLAPNFPGEVRVTEFRHTGPSHFCYVRVEASRASGTVALFFFRHDDGSWWVFPPVQKQPAMSTLLRAA